MNQIVLLGPQRSRPTVSAALRDIGDSRRLAVISAGWQEREAELEPLAGHLDGAELIDLKLYARAESVFEQDNELQTAWRERQEWLKELQRLYRRRLRHQLRAVRELERSKGIRSLIDRERADALAAVRELDRTHMRKIRSVQFDHWQRWQPADRPAVAGHRREIARLLEGCDALLIAGGHVGVLLNRLRLFDLGPLIGNMTLVAWSAGAMALSSQVVLFHDCPPQGAGDPELFDAGLSVFRGVAVFPDGTRRLTLDDTARVGLLAGRLRPAQCIVLDEESIFAWDGREWRARGPVRALSPEGGTKVLSP